MHVDALAVAAKQCDQDGQGHDGEILTQEHSHAVAAVETVDFRAIHKQAQDDRRTAEGYHRPQGHGFARRTPKRERCARTKPQRDNHLHDPTDHRPPAEAAETLHGEFEPKAEQQQRHPEFGNGLDLGRRPYGLHAARAPQQHSGQQVPNQWTLAPDPGKQPAKHEAAGQQHDDIE